jgi:hypothetical protein
MCVQDDCPEGKVPVWETDRKDGFLRMIAKRETSCKECVFNQFFLLLVSFPFALLLVLPLAAMLLLVILATLAIGVLTLALVAPLHGRHGCHRVHALTAVHQTHHLIKTRSCRFSPIVCKHRSDEYRERIRRTYLSCKQLTLSKAAVAGLHNDEGAAIQIVAELQSIDS